MRKLSHFALLVSILLALAVIVLPTVTYAQDDPQTVVTDDEVNEIAKDVYCPVCENTPLDVCATQACADWRELIRTKLAEGQTPQEIFEYFARQYGDGVLANPPQRGVSLVVLWVLPIVLVLAGILVFARYVSSLRAAKAEPVAAAGGVAMTSQPPARSDDDYAARVERELQQNS